MNKKWIIIALIAGVVLLGLLAVGPMMSDVETPKYSVIKSQDTIEIRLYKPMIIAEVEVEGPREDSVSDGFRLLADYIFGNNTVKKDIKMTAPVQQEENKRIPMTAPVQQQESTKIDMTAPVQQTAVGSSWKVSFVMPSDYKMETLPQPNDDRVTLKEIPEKKFAVIRFSGRNTHSNLKNHEEKLKIFITDNKLSVIGAPKYAFYNPPWTLPFMRRNEIMLEIKD